MSDELGWTAVRTSLIQLCEGFEAENGPDWIMASLRVRKLINEHDTALHGDSDLSLSTESHKATKPEILNVPELSSYIGTPEKTLAKWRCEGRGPAYSKLGGKIIYQLDDVDAWIKKNKRTSTAKQGLKAI